MVTASHNPLDYNGLKLVGPGARPLTDQEFKRIRDLTASGDFTAPPSPGARAVAGAPQREAYAARPVRLRQWRRWPHPPSFAQRITVPRG